MLVLIEAVKAELDEPEAGMDVKEHVVGVEVKAFEIADGWEYKDTNFKQDLFSIYGT